VASEAQQNAGLALVAYLQDHLERKRRRPGEDMLSSIMAITGEDRWSDTELLGMCITFVLTAIDATSSAIGFLFYHLAWQPSLRRSVIDDPTLIVPLIEEVLRIEPPIGELQEVKADHPHATALVSPGPPCAGVTLAGPHVDAIGEITVKSPSLAEGYWRDDQQTAAVFRDGAFATEDLGFVRDGYLYPVGRTDDMISISGRKIYAREIERTVEVIPGVRRGCSTLVVHPDGGMPRLTLLMEVKPGYSDYQEAAIEAAALSMAKAAVGIDECMFLDRDTLPKTPSGKIQRHRCHALTRAGSFEPLATIQLGDR
jgi:acyl-CoA synthetase (AMP-forming)/AMP-acid ligase II